MTLRIAPPNRKRQWRCGPFVPAFALAVSLACAAVGQEPAPETPPTPPDESAMLPEDRDKMPNPDKPGLTDEKLPNPPPPGALPIRGLQGSEPQNLPEWMQEEAAQPPPITEPPVPEPARNLNLDITSDVALNQALNTGDTLLGSLGGLEGILSSPFLASAPDEPSGTPTLRPLRLGSFDVNLHATGGVAGTHIGGPLFEAKTSASGLFQGGLSALFGRDRRATFSFSYDFVGSYPENPAQGRQVRSGSEGGRGRFDQNLSLIGNFVFPELRRVKFVFGANYANLSGVDRDTRGNSRRQIATALFITRYQYSKKTEFSLNVSVPVRQVSNGVSSEAITGTLFANTDLTQKTSVGVGYTFGALRVESGSDQIYHQALVRLKYSPTRFLLFDGTAGVDFRDRGDSSSVAPIFGLSTTWDSQHGTLMTLAAERRIFNSASTINTNFTSTSITLGVYQRFWQGVIGSLKAAYEYTEYENFGTGAGSSRIDKLYYASAGATVPLTHHWNCSLNTAAGKNDSGLAGFDFLQVTFKTTLNF